MKTIKQLKADLAGQIGENAIWVFWGGLFFYAKSRVD